MNKTLAHSVITVWNRYGEHVWKHLVIYTSSRYRATSLITGSGICGQLVQKSPVITLLLTLLGLQQLPREICDYLAPNCPTLLIYNCYLCQLCDAVWEELQTVFLFFSSARLIKRLIGSMCGPFTTTGQLILLPM